MTNAMKHTKYMRYKKTVATVQQTSKLEKENGGCLSVWQDRLVILYVVSLVIQFYQRNLAYLYKILMNTHRAALGKRLVYRTAG